MDLIQLQQKQLIQQEMNHHSTAETITIDTTAPTISSIAVASDNPNENSLANGKAWPMQVTLLLL